MNDNLKSINDYFEKTMGMITDSIMGMNKAAGIEDHDHKAGPEDGGCDCQIN